MQAKEEWIPDFVSEIEILKHTPPAFDRDLEETTPVCCSAHQDKTIHRISLVAF